MKTTISLITLLFVITQISLAQNTGQKNSDPLKTINVNGHAEIKVAPNEVYFQIVLREYMEGKTKISIDSLEQNLITVLDRIGIPRNHLSIDNVNGSAYCLRRKSRTQLVSQVYELKIVKPDHLQPLVYAVDELNVYSFMLSRTEHTAKDSLILVVKNMASANALARANTILDGLGEKTAGALYASETGSFAVVSMADVMDQVPGVQMWGSASLNVTTVTGSKYSKNMYEEVVSTDYLSGNSGKSYYSGNTTEVVLPTINIAPFIIRSDVQVVFKIE